MSHNDQPSGTHPLAKPTFSRFDQAPSPTRTSPQVPNTGFREWLRKITYGEPSSAQLACEQVRLEQIRRLVQSMLSAHLVGMSSRDLRVYLRFISASRLAVIREMRFECFDLMCRKISEPVAVRQLQQLDSLIA